MPASSLGTAPSSLPRTSANGRPDETLMCSTAIVRDMTEIFVMAASQRFLSGSGFLDRVCGLADHVKHEVRLRQHRHMTAVGLDGGRYHALCRSAFQIGVNRAVLGGDDGPAR